jgi:predicted dehydrogenase
VTRRTPGAPAGDGRRAFLKQLAGATALLTSARGLALAELPAEEGPKGEPLRIGVVGCGPWGREILETLARAPWARVVAVCDTYPAFLKRGGELAPAARAVADYRELLDLAEVEAVVVATPSHRHRDVSLAALAAAKHVYCEAPLATTLDDARAIAQAAAQSKAVFQGGVQGRSNLLYRHVSKFVRSGVLGSEAQITARWSRKDSWRRAAPNAAREAELNWRLAAASSAGLPGEVGLHQFDVASQFLGALPESVTGFGSTRQWRDGRDVPDTVHCVLDYPQGVRLAWSATLASSVAGSFTLFQGSNSSVMLRETRGWLVKEADSPLLGWEVYARKESVLDEAGIALVADATKILAAGHKPGDAGSAEATKPPLFAAFEDFCRAVREGAPSPCGPRAAFEATAIALACHRAALGSERVPIPRESLQLT